MNENLPLPVTLRFAAPILLVLVAVIQNVVAHTTTLTPWKGGGFGMFSTVDDPDARWVRCYVGTNGSEVAVEAPPSVARDLGVISALPTHRRLERLAGDLCRYRWVNADFDRDPKEAPAACPSSAQPVVRAWETGEREPKASEIAPVNAIRVELWRLKFDLPSRRVVAWRADAASTEIDH